MRNVWIASWNLLPKWRTHEESNNSIRIPLDSITYVISGLQLLQFSTREVISTRKS